MSFALQIKKEILSRELSSSNAKVLLAGILDIFWIQTTKQISIKMTNKNILKIISEILNELNIRNNFAKSKIIVDEFDKKKEFKLPGIYFAGLFIGGGSISDFNSTSYHLELQFHSEQRANVAKKLLNKYGFKFNLISRRNRSVIYIKKSEQISDFLKSINAYNSLFIFEEARIKRDHLNQLNRYLNFDFHNQNKLVISHNDFLNNFNKAKKDNHLNNFNKEQMNFFELKIKNPYMSLSELTILFNEKYKTNKTKSALNHYIMKLKKIAQ